MVVVKAVILTILILLSLLNDTSRGHSLNACNAAGGSQMATPLRKVDDREKKRKGEISGPLTNCVFYLMTGAQHFFQQTVKEGVHSEMKIFVFGLATSNELRGGVTKKNAKRWDNVRYGGG
jgi:hypothetical protein